MYLYGFGNYHSTEALSGALPTKQNSPQLPPHGLIAEQISGSAFTLARAANLHSWLYRQKPSSSHYGYTPLKKSPTQAFDPLSPPNPMRWSAPHDLKKTCDFFDGLFHVAGNAIAEAYWYHATKSMPSRFIQNRDGEFIFLPYQGEITLRTELGHLTIRPGEIAVIPCGIQFTVDVTETAKGYLFENLDTPLRLPELGLIGANGLANPRHFRYPVASFEDSHEKTRLELLCKYQRHWWHMSATHTPLNVVAWHGNYAPYCYDLSLFNTINTVSFDHPDPSIFTVLTSPSASSGLANLDFVIFPERWMVAENTFRLPYFHRNCMSELMGLIAGYYDAKQEGFDVGGISIHNRMTPHGPDKKSYESARNTALKPEKYKNTLAFMFESRLPWLLTSQALTHPAFQKKYAQCWDW